MILYGRYRSPFTRRVAISMRLLGMEYEHKPITAWTHLQDVRALNPVGRIPALTLDSGEILFDSYAILDYLDTLAGPERALVPATEPQRHEIQRIVAAAMGTLEKIVAALYEQAMHPAEKIHPPWVQHNEDQAKSGLKWLNELHRAPRVCGERITQADVTTVAMFDFARIVNSALVGDAKYPELDALAARCDALPAFAATLPVSDADKASPALPK